MDYNNNQTFGQNNYLSFLNELSIVNDKTPQHITIRSNEYFTVQSSQQQQHPIFVPPLISPNQHHQQTIFNQNNNIPATNNRNSQQQQSPKLTIKLQNLINPHLTILQSYKLLNPYDKMFTFKKQYNNLQQQHLYQYQQQQQQRQYQYQPHSQKVQQFINKICTSTFGRTKNYYDNYNRNNYHCQYSIFFLYYIKKLYNQLWQRSSISSSKSSASSLIINQQQLSQSLIQTFQLRLVYAVYKMCGQQLMQHQQQQQNNLQVVIYKLFQLLQFDKLPITKQSRQFHKSMQQFLLYKLYKLNGVRSQWSQKYEDKLKSISYEDFSILYSLENRLNPYIIPVKEIQDSIVKEENLLAYFQQQQQQQFIKQQQQQHNVFINNSSKPTTVHFSIQNPQLQSKSKQSHIQQFVKNMISVLIQNLYNYQLVENYTERNNSMLDLFGFKVRKCQKEQKKNQGEINGSEDNYIEKLYEQFLPNNPQHHIPTQLTTSKQTFNYHPHPQPTFLSQLHHPNLFYNSSQEMFTKLVPIIAVDLFIYFQLSRRHSNENYHQMYMKNKKWFIQLSMETLVWKEGIKAMEVDKLYLWGLLFGVENKPIVIGSPVDNIDTYIKSFQPSTKNIVTKTIRNLIRSQLQPITILDYKTNQNNHPSPYLFIFPFLHLLILSYEIFQPKQIQLFIQQLKEKYQQQTLQQNLLQLVKDLYQQYVQCIYGCGIGDRIKGENSLSPSQNKLSRYSNQLISTLAKYHQNLIDAGVEILSQSH